MSRIRCACGAPSIGVTIVAHKPIVVCRQCYREACLQFALGCPYCEAGCPECPGNRADCECYRHQPNEDDPHDPVSNLSLR